MVNRPYWDEVEMVNNGDGAEILALGDSWFWYPANNLLNPIFRWLSPARVILALGANGAEAQDYLHDFYLDDFTRCLKTYTNIRAVLLSGGGNDFAGLDDFGDILKEDCSGITDAAKCFKAGQPGRLLDKVAAVYDELVARVKKHRPEAKVFVHQYDYAIPTGKGFFGLGQWLKAPMDAASITDANLQQQVVNRLIDLLGERLAALEAGSNGRGKFLRTAGTLNPEQWANELHPTPRGFNKIARAHWVDSVQAAFA